MLVICFASGIQLSDDEMPVAHELGRFLGWHHRLHDFAQHGETVHAHVSNHRLDACHLHDFLGAWQLPGGCVSWAFK